MKELKHLFPLGRIIVTPGVANLELRPTAITTLLLRHSTGDWANMEEHDRKLNQAAIDNPEYKDRIVSSFKFNDQTILVITDAGWKITTVLLAEEY